jgi:hypothetical protein
VRPIVIGKGEIEGRGVERYKERNWGRVEEKKGGGYSESETNKNDLGGYWWPPTYSNWLLVSIFYSTHLFVLLYNCEFYNLGVV